MTKHLVRDMKFDELVKDFNHGSGRMWLPKRSLCLWLVYATTYECPITVEPV